MTVTVFPIVLWSISTLPLVSGRIWSNFLGTCVHTVNHACYSYLELNLFWGFMPNSLCCHSHGHRHRHRHNHNHGILICRFLWVPTCMHAIALWYRSKEKSQTDRPTVIQLTCLVIAFEFSITNQRMDTYAFSNVSSRQHIRTVSNNHDTRSQAAPRRLRSLSTWLTC